MTTPTPEAPASSGDPWQRVGHAIRDALAGVNNAAVGALNAGADAVGSVLTPQKPDYGQVGQDIRGRQATVTGEGPSIADVVQSNEQNPSLSQRIYAPVLGAAQGFQEGSIRDSDRLTELWRKDKMFGGPGMTDAEEAEAARLFITQYADIGGVTAVKGIPGVVGQAAKPILEEAARKGVPDAAEALAVLASKAKGAVAPSMGIVSNPGEPYSGVHVSSGEIEAFKPWGEPSAYDIPSRVHRGVTYLAEDSKSGWDGFRASSRENWGGREPPSQQAVSHQVDVDPSIVVAQDMFRGVDWDNPKMEPEWDRLVAWKDGLKEGQIPQVQRGIDDLFYMATRIDSRPRGWGFAELPGVQKAMDLMGIDAVRVGDESGTSLAVRNTSKMGITGRQPVTNGVPASGIVSRAQADEAGRTIGRGGEIMPPQPERFPQTEWFDPQYLGRDTLLNETGVPSQSARRPPKPDQYVYHFTAADDIPAIEQRGLVPRGSDRGRPDEFLTSGGGRVQSDGVYAADNAGILSVVGRDADGGDGWALTRFKAGSRHWVKDPESSADYVGSWVTKHSVKPDEIEVWTESGWRPLTDKPPPTDRYYHGTGSDFTRPDPGKFDPNGLFGPGYYITDDPRVAGSGNAENFRTMGYAEAAQSAKVPERLRQQYEELAQETETLRKNIDTHQLGRAEIEKWIAGNEADMRAIEARGGTAGPNIRPVDVPRDLRLLDAEVGTPVVEAERLISHVADSLSRAGDDYAAASVRRRLDTLWRDVRDFDGTVDTGKLTQYLYGDAGFAAGRPTNDESRWIVQKALAAAGYDGLSHAGGKRIPMMDEAGKPIEHNVKVIFPESLDKITNATAGTPGGFISSADAAQGRVASGPAGLGRYLDTAPEGSVILDNQAEGNRVAQLVRSSLASDPLTREYRLAEEFDSHLRTILGEFEGGGTFPPKVTDVRAALSQVIGDVEAEQAIKQITQADGLRLQYRYGDDVRSSVYLFGDRPFADAESASSMYRRGTSPPKPPLPSQGTIGVTGRAVGAGAGSAYQESQQEGATPESVLKAGAGGAATSMVNAGASRLLGRRAVGTLSRAVAESGDNPKRTTAFSPTDPNVTYELEHRVVDLGQLITSHGDDFKPNPRFPSELQPRQRDRVAATQQVSRIASELNPDALLTDTRSIQTGSPIIGPDNIVESGNGRVMALRQAIRRNPEAAKRYRGEIERVAADYGIDPAELQGKRFPVLVRERLSDVDRKAFAREANESSTAVVSGFERSLGDAELLTDDLISGLTVAENQSIDQALSAPGNRGIVRAFTSSLPQNEAGTMMDAMGNLSEEGVRRVKQALIIKAYGNSVTGQRMARSMIESIDPGVKNVETAIYGSLPSIARVEAVSMRGDLSISTDIAKAADMYARLKQNGISVADYMNQGSLWERETTPVQDALIQAFEANKRSARRIRDILEGYAERAEPQANPAQGDLFGGTVARATKEDILDSAIQDFGGLSEEAAGAATPSVREGLDGGESVLRRVPEYREPGAAPATATAEGARPPIGPVRIGSDSLQPELPGSEPSRGLYVGAARRRTNERLESAVAQGRPITLTDEQEIARLRLDKFFPGDQEMQEEVINAARNADWWRAQRRGVVPDVDVQAASARSFASIDEAIRTSRIGKAYNAEETIALRNLLHGQTEIVKDYARQLSEPLTKSQRDRLVAEQLAEAQKLTAIGELAFGGAPSEAGRALRQYRQFSRSLKDNPEEAGLRFIRDRFGSMDGAEKAVATYVQMIQDGASPVELAAFLRNVRPAWMDRLNIIRYGSMLSGTTTHLRNITGNIINIGQDIGLKPVAAGIDAARARITGGQRTRYLGETSEMARGMLEGIPTGLRDLATTLRTGVNPNEIQTIDNLRGGFGSGSGKVDAAFEAPLRALSGADAFFRAVTMGGHSRAVAFRKASQEGLTGTARAERVQEIVENLWRNLDVLDDASRASARDILQEDRRAVRAGMQLRESMNGFVPYLGDAMFPFVRTPINIAAQGLEMSPAGFISVIKDARAGNVGEATDTAARALFGTALMYGAGTLAMNNMLTGSYPEDARTRSTLPPGWQPYSLKLGDRYIQYSNLGPFGIPIATAVILAEAKKSGKPIDPGAVAMSMGKYLGDQTFMRGLSDFVKAFNDPTRYGENVAENLGTQLAPYSALGRQVERAMGMAQKDPHGAWEALQATYPFSAGGVANRTDSRGQPIMPNQTGLETFISPTNISTEKPDQVLTVLRKNGIGIGAPPKSLVTPDGRSVELTPKQKQQFQQLLYSEIQQNLVDFNDPSEAERAMGRARARARESMLLAVR